MPRNIEWLLLLPHSQSDGAQSSGSTPKLHRWSRATGPKGGLSGDGSSPDDLVRPSPKAFRCPFDTIPPSGIPLLASPPPSQFAVLSATYHILSTAISCLFSMPSYLIFFSGLGSKVGVCLGCPGKKFGNFATKKKYFLNPYFWVPLGWWVSGLVENEACVNLQRTSRWVDE